MKERGAFIVFEGVDHSGKTTQCELLERHLKATGIRQCMLMRFPRRDTVIGKLINDYLESTLEMSDEVVHLLYSANRWEAAKEIQEALNNGTTVICDRYAYSGIVFSAAKGLDLQWCKNTDDGLPAPDCVIYLDIPIEQCAERGDFGRERYERLDFQKDVHRLYTHVRLNDADTWWLTIDASNPIDIVHGDIVTAINAIQLAL